jgi:hypothetical protein
LNPNLGNRCTPCQLNQLLASQQRYASTYCKWVSTDMQRMPCIFKNETCTLGIELGARTTKGDCF